jgi:copper chaperone NosL
MGGSMKYIYSALFLVLLTATMGFTDEMKPAKPSKTDKCPVCGMFVAKYPDFIAGMTFKDGSHAVFDGAKDMFKFYFDIKKYQPSKSLSDIASLYVTDYYSMTQINAQHSYFVTGSNVHGPMGNEFIPFEKKDDAQQFMADHFGKKLLQFDDVTQDIVKSLD